MFAQMKSSRSSGPSRATLCKQSGCSCYCHAPKKALISKTITIIVALFMIAFWWVPLKWALDSERKACEKTQTCQICDVTSTGAPYNCRPDPQFGKKLTIRKDGISH